MISVNVRKEWEGLTAIELLRKVLEENAELNLNMSLNQTRCTELLERVRSDRKRILELGGPDPGPP